MLPFRFVRITDSMSNLNLSQSLETDGWQITGDVFFDIFPYIVVFNRGMRVRNIGLGLLRLMPKLIGAKFPDAFVLLRPHIRFRWEEVASRLSLFIFLFPTCGYCSEKEIPVASKTFVFALESRQLEFILER